MSFKPEGLFKIEAENPIYGEKVQWNVNYYRLKHIISGRYLCIDDLEATEDFLYLVKEPTPDSSFCFVPIQSEPSEMESRNVKIGSYYKLKSKTKKYLRLPIHRLTTNSFEMKRGEEVGFSLKSCTHIDTLIVNIASAGFIREKPFLLSSYPIFIELLVSLEELNKEIGHMLSDNSKSADIGLSINYGKFKNVFPKVIEMTNNLKEYLLNTSPSNIE